MKSLIQKVEARPLDASLQPSKPFKKKMYKFKNIIQHESWSEFELYLICL